jgi:hypothetical protein
MEESELLKGGYGIPYDPRPALEKLSSSRDEAIAELWENLYHQGDVGPASYATVPALVRVGELSLVAAIEVARHSESNPDVPDSLVAEYDKALKDALSSSPTDEEQLVGYYIIHASLSGQPRLAKALQLMDLDEVLSEYG